MTTAAKGPHAPGDLQPQEPCPFSLLPAMNLVLARPLRRSHPEGRSAAEEARSALPSCQRTGTMPPSHPKQENHAATAQNLPPALQINLFQSRPSRPKLSLVPLSRNWGPLQIFGPRRAVSGWCVTGMGRSGRS